MLDKKWNDRHNRYVDKKGHASEISIPEKTGVMEGEYVSSTVLSQ
jgi:hypothetical protein